MVKLPPPGSALIQLDVVDAQAAAGGRAKAEDAHTAEPVRLQRVEGVLPRAVGPRTAPGLHPAQPAPQPRLATEEPVAQIACGRPRAQERAAHGVKRASSGVSPRGERRRTRRYCTPIPLGVATSTTPAYWPAGVSTYSWA